MMARINNRAELNVEKLRLNLLRKEYESHFETRVKELKQRVVPYQNLFKRADHIFSPGKGKVAGDGVTNAIQMGIPLLIDRLFLGTRGLILKRVAIWVSEFAATRLSQEIPADMMKKFSTIMPLLSKIPFINKYLKKV